ncbi:hypothetical protein LIER_38814 [Lithospermum erythrorhizon]|uniref:DUF7787 domain-containing protein n=1 Tax=Lithospermum erythrorhizon TaxID=34254 RepID=A0AAV3Q6J5_LITER
MESAVATRVRYKPSKLTMDEYIFFSATKNIADLTVDHLNQIIELHGFKKIHKVHKSIMYDVVKSMELMNPCRSTLEDNQVSSHAVLCLDEVVKGLNDLGWQECCVTSMQMFNSVDLQDGSLNASNNILVTASGSSSKGKTTVRRRKKLRLSDVESNFGANAVDVDARHDLISYGLETASNTSECRGAKKLAPRRKRNVGVLGDINTNVLSGSMPW